MPASIKSLVLSEVRALAVSATRTATLTGTGVQVDDFEGMAVATLHSAKGTANADNILDVKLQECDTIGGTYADIAGAAFSTVLGTGGADVLADIPVDMTMAKKFIRVVGTVGGTTPSFVYGVTIRGFKKYR
jgi:hypothetical protein